MSAPNIKFNLPFSIGLSDSPPEVEPKMRPIISLMYNAFLQIQQAMHQYLGLGQQLQTLWDQIRYDQTLHTFSPNRLYLRASEDISYGFAVNIWNDAGTLKFRKANATNNTKPCHGFCTTLGGILSGTFGEVIVNFGMLVGVAGLTTGTRYFLSTTDGLITSTAPVAAGNIEQVLGLAMDTGALLFNFDFAWIQH